MILGFPVSFPLAFSPIPGGCTPASTLVQGSPGGPTRLLLSVPHLLIPNSPLSAGQMSPHLDLQAQGVCLEAEPHLWAWLWY